MHVKKLFNFLHETVRRLLRNSASFPVVMTAEATHRVRKIVPLYLRL